MLTGLTLHVTSLAVSLGNCSGEVTITRNHDEGHICCGDLSINDSEMPYLSVELLCGVCNVHVVSQCERRLAQTIGLSLQLLQFVLGDDTDLED